MTLVHSGEQQYQLVVIVVAQIDEYSVQLFDDALFAAPADVDFAHVVIFFFVHLMNFGLGVDVIVQQAAFA